MGKRGPSAKGEYGDKSAVLSTRISSELRAALERSVEKTGLTLSREIEHRLRRSFEDDDEAIERFGSRRNRALMKMLALSMQTAWNSRNPDADWMQDPVMFEQVVRTLQHILNGYRPNQPIPDLPDIDELRSIDAAASLMQVIKTADAALPLKVTARQHIANVIKSDLGDIADRPQIFFGTADEMRAEADRMDAANTKRSKPKRTKK